MLQRSGALTRLFYVAAEIGTVVKYHQFIKDATAELLKSSDV